MLAGWSSLVVPHPDPPFCLPCDPSNRRCVCRQFIRDGHAFMDNTPREQMQEERMKLVESVHR